MKKLFLTLILLFSTSIFFAQENIIQKEKAKNDLTEVTIYYESGNVMQHGFYTSESKLHGSWESYYSNGQKKCIAFYNNGIKTGIWTYWNKDKISKVTYKNDTIVNIEEINAEERIKNNL